jgi:hypothetical protein
MSIVLPLLLTDLNSKLPVIVPELGFFTPETTTRTVELAEMAWKLVTVTVFELIVQLTPAEVSAMKLLSPTQVTAGLLELRAKPLGKLMMKEPLAGMMC